MTEQQVISIKETTRQQSKGQAVIMSLANAKGRKKIKGEIIVIKHLYYKTSFLTNGLCKFKAVIKERVQMPQTRDDQ